MDGFIKKWHENKKFRAQIKLLGYFLFIIMVSLFARTLNTNTPIIPEEDKKENKSTTDVIFIPEKYNLEMTVLYNDETYKFTQNKTTLQESITKETPQGITYYLYKDNQYYQNKSGTYLVTTKEDVYSPIEKNYLDLENINLYLSKATIENHQYLIPIKEIILGNDTDEYFIITINNNKIDIDYTPLAKKFSSDIDKLNVKINLTEIK